MATRAHGPTLVTLRLSSNDRTSGSNSAPVWKLSRPVAVYHSLVTGATIPNSMYTVSAGVNDIIPTSLGNATIAPGIYTPTALAAAAQTALVAVDATFTCAYSTTTLKFTIARGAGVFGLTWATGTATNARRALGYSAADLAAAATYTGDLAVTGSDPAVVLLRSAALSGGAQPGIYVLPASGTDVARIPLAGALGSGSSSYEASLPLEMMTYSSYGTILAEIDVSLWDATTGAQVNLNGAPWTVEITLWINEDKTRL